MDEILEHELRDLFKDHIATLTNLGNNVTMLNWVIPEKTLYGITYILKDGCLMVYGDFGEAIYRWTEPNDFDWLADTDLGYFKSKCCASESGREFMRWDIYKAKEEWKIRTSIDSLTEYTGDEEYKARQLIEYWSGKIKEAEAYLSNEREWESFIEQNGDLFLDLFGSDYWESNICRIGIVTHEYCIRHWFGIKLAMEQLRSKDERTGNVCCDTEARGTVCRK